MTFFITTERSLAKAILMNTKNIFLWRKKKYLSRYPSYLELQWNLCKQTTFEIDFSSWCEKMAVL